MRFKLAFLYFFLYHETIDCKVLVSWIRQVLEKNNAKINLTPKKIYEQEFKTSIRGYDKTEVDEFLDDVIKDYTVYIALVKELQEENAKLKAKATSAPASRPAYASATSEPSHATANIASASNYDILKRISRLEKEVFGKQIVE